MTDCIESTAEAYRRINALEQRVHILANDPEQTEAKRDELRLTRLFLAILRDIAEPRCV